MKFIAHIDIMPLEELLDPQGKAVLKNLHNIDIDAVDQLRIGKHVRMELDAENQDQAEEIVERACKKLLANVIMEDYSYEVKPKESA
jgi:phosphoribosylformylglycinamidine synthase